MKLLLAFKSFLPRRLIVEIGSENWFAAGSQFGSENSFAAGNENYFAAGTTVSAVNHKFAAANSTSAAICCRQLHFGSESQVRCRTRHSAANC
jgi:hypothetical protein